MIRVYLRGRAVEALKARLAADPRVEIVDAADRADAVLSLPASAAGDADLLVEALTGREQEVLSLLAGGLPNREIASALSISEHTVKFHLASIFGKLGVSTRTEAVQRGVRLGVIDL